MVKALADRLAEAFAEYLHGVCVKSTGAMRRTRTSATKNDPRKLPGHPSGTGLPGLPGTTEKATIWELLEVEKHTGMKPQNLLPCGLVHRFRVGTSATGQQVLCGSANSARPG